MKKNKSLGKNLQDILNEQETKSIVKALYKMDVTVGFPGNRKIKPIGFENRMFIYETPDQRANRLNDELQGCF